MKTTIVTLGLAVLVAATVGGPAGAQTLGNNSAYSNSTSNASAVGVSGSTSGATASGGTSSSGVTNNLSFSSPSTTSSTSAVHYSGSYSVSDVPSVVPPSIFGGTNPCTVGVSGGLSVTGFGLGLGGTWSDKGCERRNGAVILFQANMPDVAVALLCEDTGMRDAFSAAGKPCPQERREMAQAAAAAPAPAPASAPVVMVAPAAPMVATPVSASGYQGPTPAWCASPSRTASDQAAHNYYCH